MGRRWQGPGSVVAPPRREGERPLQQTAAAAATEVVAVGSAQPALPAGGTQTTVVSRDDLPKGFIRGTICKPPLYPPWRAYQLRWNVQAYAAWQTIVAWMLTCRNIPTTMRRQAGIGHTLPYPSSREINAFFDSNLTPEARVAFEYLLHTFAPGYPAIRPRSQWNWWYAALFHRDGWRNGGPSILFVGGEFTGGQLYLAGRTYAVDRPLVFDGRCWHKVLPFVGKRVSLVIYYDANEIPVNYLIGREATDPPRLVRRAATGEYRAQGSRIFAIRRNWDAFALSESECGIDQQLRAFKHELRDLWRDHERAYPLKPVPNTTIPLTIIEKFFINGDTWNWMYCSPLFGVASSHRRWVLGRRF